MRFPHHHYQLWLLAVGLTMPLAGCTVGPNFVRPTPQTPAHWADVAASNRPDEHARDSAMTEETADLRRWWADFNDPTLSSLIERAVDSNLDLRVAVLRIEEARAQRGVTAASLWPSLAANASYTRTRLSETTPTGALFSTIGQIKIPGAAGISIPNPYNQYQLGADVSWELDLFGRVRRSVEAADANIEQSVEDQIRSGWHQHPESVQPISTWRRCLLGAGSVRARAPLGRGCRCQYRAIGGGSARGAGVLIGGCRTKLPRASRRPAEQGHRRAKHSDHE